MTHFRDLAPCTYFPFAPGRKLLAVGWLDPDHKYTRGKVARRVVVNLRRLLVQPWQPVLTPGWHDCEFCERRSRSFKFSYEGNRSESAFSTSSSPEMESCTLLHH